MIRLACAVLVLLAVAALSACGSAAHPAPDWYARGKAFAVADYKAGDTGNIGAYLPWPYFCTEVLSDHGSKGTSGVGVPLNALGHAFSAVTSSATPSSTQAVTWTGISRCGIIALITRWSIDHAACAACGLVRASASCARIAKSTCRATRGSRRTRSGSMAHSCLRVPNSRSTAPRTWVS